MKVRIRFSKEGSLVYIGHLDVMRYFQKLFRRADLPVKYSEGFSPHQILSFTPPLPLGMESFGEYADVELTENVTTADALERLRAQSVPEITICSFKMLPEGSENAMASVAAASYRTKICDSKTMQLMEKAASALMSQKSVIITKKTKKSEKEINIRPLIYSLCADEDNGTLDMLISSGSIDNLKPSHVFDALFEIGGFTADTDMFDTARLDQFTSKDEKLVSLDDIGSDINE